MRTFTSFKRLSLLVTVLGLFITLPDTALVQNSIKVTAAAQSPFPSNRPYRTLAGIHPGKTYSLLNPSSDRVEVGKVVRTAPQNESHLPLVWISFPDKSVVRYCADRIQLVNNTIEEQRYLTNIHADVHHAIRLRLGYNTSSIPILVLDGRNWAVNPKLPNRILGPFMTEWFRRGDNFEPLRKGIYLPGFALSGRIVVHRSEGAFDEKTVAHQLIHVLSSNFRRQAIDSDCNPLVEGLTEYFTYEVARPAWGRLPHKDEVSYEPLRVAQSLVSELGRDVVKQHFFDGGGGVSFFGLGKVLGKGKRNRLEEICRRLDKQENRFKESDPSGKVLPY